jgi:ribosomal protein L14
VHDILTQTTTNVNKVGDVLIVILATKKRHRKTDGAIITFSKRLAAITAII